MGIKIIPFQVDNKHEDTSILEIEQMPNTHLSTIAIVITVGDVNMR